MSKVKLIKISKSKGQSKDIIEKGYFKEKHGLEGDIHAGAGKRQVSILGVESRNKIKERIDKGLCTLKFTENITTEGIELYKYPLGTKFRIGEAEMEISQVGKACYKECSIHEISSKCVLSNECIFTKVIKSGWVKIGDKIDIIY